MYWPSACEHTHVNINEPWLDLTGHSVATHNALAKVIIRYTTPLWLVGWENNVRVRKSRTERGNVQRDKTTVM